MIMLQNVSEVNRVCFRLTAASSVYDLTAASSVYDSTKHNGLITVSFELCYTDWDLCKVKHVKEKLPQNEKVLAKEDVF